MAALAGIVLRGAGFAFRKEVSGLGAQRAFGAIFAFSSLLTPFFMGTVIGAIATGQVPADASHASLAAWTSATSLLIGFVFTGACGYLAAVYLVGEAARRGDGRLRAYFTRRAQAAGIVTGALSLATLAELHSSNAVLFSRLTGRALPLVIIAGVCGIAVVALLTTGLTVGLRSGVRVIAALGVAAVIWGWGVAQYPVLLPGTNVTLSNAGAPDSTQTAIVVLFAAAVVIVGPSFALLFSLHGRRLLYADDADAVLATAPAHQDAARPPDRSRLPPLPPSGPRSSAWSSSMPSSAPGPAGEAAESRSIVPGLAAWLLILSTRLGPLSRPWPTTTTASPRRTRPRLSPTSSTATTRGRPSLTWPGTWPGGGSSTSAAAPAPARGAARPGGHRDRRRPQYQDAGAGPAAAR